ncbi:hypothetical protein KC921_04220 [Candidatus Woesebacteria bacterium]|nr:hypothetical protein [Candidatus Woesebacteria bacterium]
MIEEGLRPTWVDGLELLQSFRPNSVSERNFDRQGSNVVMGIQEAIAAGDVAEAQALVNSAPSIFESLVPGKGQEIQQALSEYLNSLLSENQNRRSGSDQSTLESIRIDGENKTIPTELLDRLGISNDGQTNIHYEDLSDQGLGVIVRGGARESLSRVGNIKGLELMFLQLPDSNRLAEVSRVGDKIYVGYANTSNDKVTPRAVVLVLNQKQFDELNRQTG